jgi:hypothetical protein
MTAGPDVAERSQAVVDTALECVERLIAAANRHDLDGCRDLLDASVRVRIDGSLVAAGVEEATGLIQNGWRSRPEAAIHAMDIRFAGGIVYVRYTVEAQQPLVGYSLFDVRRGRVHEASHFFAGIRPGAAIAEPTFEEPTIDLRPTEPALDLRVDAPPVPARRWAHRVGFPVIAIGSALVEDTLLATPLIATAARFGSVRAFLVFAPLYTALSLVLALVTLHVLCAPRDAHHGRLARWLAKTSHSRRTKLWLKAGSTFGFVLSASVLGSPATVWALHTLGARRHLRRDAVIASAVWSVAFALTYLLAAEVVFL